MVSANTLPRKFKLGASLLDDPAPSMPLEQVHEMLVHQYPMMRHTTLFESDAKLSSCETYLEYEIVLPPVKTQG